MPSVVKFIRKIRRKFISFKRDVSGGDMINQILMLAIALVIIGLLLVFAVAQFQKAKDGLEDLLEPPDNSSDDNLNQTLKIENKIATIIQDREDNNKVLPVDKGLYDVSYSKGILIHAFYFDSFAFLKSTN